MSNYESIGLGMPDKFLGNKTLYSTTVSKQSGMYPVASAQTVKYFSSTDAEVYFGDLFVDDIAEISFQLQQNTMPLFGYNSYVYDDIALGSRIIQGQFAVNFTKAGYMYEILETLYAAQLSSAKKMLKVPGQNEFTLADLGRYSAESPNDPIANQVNKPLWDCRFSIVMSYGNHGPKKSAAPAANSTLLSLEGVQLTGCMQQLDSSGTQVMEVYTFMARDMQFIPTATKQAPTPSTKTKPEVAKKTKDPISFKSVMYSEIKNDYYNQSLVGVIYKPHAVGKIDIEYESDLKITKLLIKPELYSNNTYWTEFVEVKADKGKASYETTTDQRKNIKEWHDNLFNSYPSKFRLNVQVFYKDKAEKEVSLDPMAVTVTIDKDKFYTNL